MPRRRLRVVVASSSGEEDEVSRTTPPASAALPLEEVRDMEEDDQTISTLNLQSVTLNSSNSISNPTPRNPNIVQPVPFNISDDDDDGSDAAAANTSGTTNVLTGNNSTPTNYPCSNDPISNILQSMGLRLRREWMESCIGGLERLVPGFSGFDGSMKAKLCFEQFLQADMNFCGAGFLPENVHSLHLVDLKGPFILQVKMKLLIAYHLV